MEKKNEFLNSYLTVTLLGKSYKLNLSYFNHNKIKMVKKENEIFLILPIEYKDVDNMEIINLSIRNLYDEVAKTEIENSMELIRHILNFAPEDYLIKRLNDCYYKTNKDIIVVNPDIVRYSRETINQTLIQAFCKLKYRTNSNNYKKLLKFALTVYQNENYRISKVS